MSALSDYHFSGGTDHDLLMDVLAEDAQYRRDHPTCAWCGVTVPRGDDYCRPCAVANDDDDYAATPPIPDAFQEDES